MATPTTSPTTETTTETGRVPAEQGLLATLGIEGKLFAAQLVNFAIVAVVLWKFAYKPLLKVMDERAEKIARGLKDADAAGAAKKIAEEAATAIVTEARAKAREIMDDVAKRAETERIASVAKAKEEVAKIIEQGREQMRTEKERMIAEAKQEVGTLVVLAAGRVLREKIDAKKDAELIEAAIAEAEAAL